MILRVLFIILISSSFSIASSVRVDSLLNELKNHPQEDTLRVNLLADIGYYSYSKDSVFQYLNEGIELAKKIDFKKGVANCYIRKGLQLARSGEYEESSKLYYEAVNLYKASNNYRLTLKCYVNLGNNYADVGNYGKSLELYNKALEVADSIHHAAYKAGILINIATLHYVQANYTKANEIFIESAKVLEKEGDEDKLAIAYGNISAIYVIQKDMKNAVLYLHKAKRLHKKIGNLKHLGNQYLNLSNLYIENGHHEIGLNYADSAMTMFSKVDWQGGIGDCYKNFGTVESRLGNYEKAIEHFNKAIDIARKINNKHGQAEVYQSQANMYLRLKQPNNAIELAEKSIEISEELKLLVFIKSSYRVLSEAYEQKNNPTKALDYYKKYIAIKDSMFNEEKHKQVAELETQYETEKKEQEIALLSKEKELDRLELEKQEAKIARRNTLLIAVIGGAILITLLSFFVYRRYKEKQKSNLLLEAQNEEIARQNKEIKDSIQYAKRIQTAILPSSKLVKSYVKNAFIYYVPKDIVSGDFYWFHQLEDGRLLYASVDCTGHGVPGAMMSVIGFNHLNQCVNEYKLESPGDILNKLHELVSNTLHQHDEFDVNDGMDLSLLLLDEKNRKLDFSGANNPLYVVRDGQIIELKANRFAIGSRHVDRETKFDNQSMQLQEGDCIYNFSDGYVDQFGGEEGRRFMKKNFKKLLIEASTKPMEEQYKLLAKTFEQWKGDLEQLDDICVIGVSV